VGGGGHCFATASYLGEEHSVGRIAVV